MVTGYAQLYVLAGCGAMLVNAGFAAAEDQEAVKKLTAVIGKLQPLHAKLGPPGPGDWLEAHPEPGQSFVQYVRSDPVTPKGKRHIIYIQPLGEFTQTEREIVNLTADFMGRYFNVPVKIEKDLPLSLVPASARRSEWGGQILTGYVLDKILKPRLPEDAAAYVAFTASDLWPGEGWNFVFGQASLQERVAVWSIYRNGNAEGKLEDFRLCLLRTMKIATHETGHMFGMEHCIAYECNMCGCNNREEADRRPIQLCPECVAKVWWAAGANPLPRYEKLASFCEKQGLTAEREFYQRLIEKLKE